MPFQRAAALCLSAVVFLAGCASAPQPSRLAAVPPPDRAALERTVQSLAAEQLVPGVVAIVRTPHGELRVRHGVSTWKGSEPVHERQHLRVGSNTKTWVGTVILQMVDEGKLRLDDPVSRYRPEVPNGQRITLEHLLTMRSGLFNYTETAELNVTMDRQPKKAWRPEDLAAMGLRLPPYFPPGQGFHYANTNTVLLGLIAQQIDGKPLADVLRDRLFLPLGMRDTLLPAVDSHDLPLPRSSGYMFGTNEMTIATTVLPADLQAGARAGTLQPTDVTESNPSWGWAAGAGISTAEDLVTWVEAMVGGRLLSPQLQARRLASVRPMKDDAPGGALYGWGLAKMGPLYGHTGELPGYNSFMGHDPAARVTVVVWANLAPGVDGRDPATTIARALIGQIYGTAR